MVDRNDFTRRGVLRASAAAVGLGSVGSVLASDTDEPTTESAEQIPPADMSEIESDLETVSPAGVVPEPGQGIHPGSMLFITREGSSGTAGCTANFIWEGSDGTKYLGSAGHCFLPGDAAAGTKAGGSYDTSKVTVKVCIDCTFGGATALVAVRGQTVELGDVVYARQSRNGDEIGNDFGLVEIPSSAEDLINPAMPTFGGPTEEGEVNTGEDICHYGNGVVLGETFVTKARTGVGVSNSSDEGSWLAELAASPGDSGSAVQGCRLAATGIQGVEAAGILTHIVLGTDTGVAGTNRAKAKQMATEAGLDIDVVETDEN